MITQEIRESSEVRPLILSDVVQAARVISHAFVDDPLCAFMLPSQRSRMETLQKFFRAYGEIYIQNQLGYGIGEPLKGIAFWINPSVPDVSMSIKSVGLFIPLLFTQYPFGYLKAKKVLNKIDFLHHKYASDAHYYLDNIAVLPSEQGKGYSSKLIRPILEKADVERRIVYTDTVTLKNVGYYEHFGFQCMEECLVESTGITIWSLRRPVQNGR
jgi:ribosomal protein S18 acetylase RimI-like enzyme